MIRILRYVLIRDAYLPCIHNVGSTYAYVYRKKEIGEYVLYAYVHIRGTYVLTYVLSQTCAYVHGHIRIAYVLHTHVHTCHVCIRMQHVCVRMHRGAWKPTNTIV